MIEYQSTNYDPTLEDSYRKQGHAGRENWMFEFERCSDYNEPVYSRGICNQFLNDTDCYALVYNSQSRASFDGIRGWHEALKYMLRQPPRWQF